MSFELDLQVPDLDRALAERLRDATEAAGGLRVLVAGRRRRWLRSRPRVFLEANHDDVPVLSDDADWEQPAFSLDDRGRELLARAIEIIGQTAPPGWSLRAAWVDDPVEREVVVTAEELAELARSSRLDRTTRYNVKPNPRHQTGTW